MSIKYSVGNLGAGRHKTTAPTHGHVRRGSLEEVMALNGLSLVINLQTPGPWGPLFLSTNIIMSFIQVLLFNRYMYVVSVIITWNDFQYSQTYTPVLLKMKISGFARKGLFSLILMLF